PTQNAHAGADAETPLPSDEASANGGHGTAATRLEPLFERIVGRFLGRDARKARRLLFGAVAAAMLLAVALVPLQLVVLKMLPFDNKSELQIVVDMPEGVSVERTAAVLDELAAVVRGVPEVSDYQLYAGTAAPINFNGLVRQYYLREGA